MAVSWEKQPPFSGFILLLPMNLLISLALAQALPAFVADHPDGDPPTFTTQPLGPPELLREPSSNLIPLGLLDPCSGLGVTEFWNAELPEGDTPTAVAFTPDGSRFLIAHAESRNVHVFDAAAGTFLAAIPVSGAPQAVSVTPGGDLFLTANFETDTVSVVSLATEAELAVIPVGTLPAGVRITADGTRAAIANYGSSDVSIVDIGSASEITRLGPVNFSSQVAFAFEPAATSFSLGDWEWIDDETLLIPELFEDRLAFVNVATLSLATVACDVDPRGLAVALGPGLAFVTHTGATRLISVVDAASQQVVQTIPVPDDLWGPIATNPAGGRLVTAIQNACRVVDVASGVSSAALPTATANQLLTTSSGLFALGVGFNGSVISFASQSIVGNTNGVVSTSLGAVSPVGSDAVLVATTFGEDAVRVDTDLPGLLGVQSSGAPPEADKARRVAVGQTAAGLRAVTTNILSDTASVLDAETGELLGVVEVGNRPSGVAIAPDGSVAVVANLDSTFASVIDLSTLAVTPVSISTRAAEVVISPDSRYAYVAVLSSGDGVWRIDLQSLQADGGKLPSGEMGGVGYAYSQTSGIALSPDGSRLITCNSFDDTVTVFDAANWTVLGTVPVGDFPTRAIVSPNGLFAYVANRDSDDISRVRIPQLGEIQRIPVGASPYDLALASDPTQLAVLVTDFQAPGVDLVNVSTGSVTASLALPNPPSGLVHDAGTNRWIVSSGTWSLTFGAVYELAFSGELTTIDSATGSVVGTTQLGAPPSDLALVGGRLCASSPFGRGFYTGAYPNDLSVDRTSISLSAGGAQTFCFDAGPGLAGSLYAVLGSATGTTPGLFVDGVTVPLVVDTYFFQTLIGLGVPPFVGTIGLLDGDGRATASFSLVPGTLPQLAGVRLYHAAVAADPIFGTALLASQPSTVDLLP